MRIKRSALRSLARRRPRRAGSSTPVSQGLLDRWLGLDSNTASESTTNRWAFVLPAFASHACIGAPYAWSLMTGPLTKEYGFVTSAAGDWTLNEATFPLMIIFALQGAAAAAGAKWQIRVGGRKSIAVAGACWGGGLMAGALGIHLHSLPLLYIGYGFFGGLGVGLGYTPPVQALIQWFPDRKGLASGMCIAGFGSGALLFAPAVTKLMSYYSTAPTFIGTKDEVATRTVDGKIFLDGPSGEQEVVYANMADIKTLSATWSETLQEGFYLVGSGSTGAAESLGTMGVVYFSVMSISSLILQRPHPNYIPAGYTPPAPSDGASSQLSSNVRVDTAMKTPQFWSLFGVFACIATGGMGLFSVAKPMMTEVFSSTLPLVVTAGFASSYLMLMSAGNLGGRICWATISDKIGRKTTFNIFTFSSVPLYAICPYLVSSVVGNQSAATLYLFCGTTFCAITMMGGTYAIMPAYEADLFGSKYVGAIHGRMMLASSVAAIVGPQIILTLRGRSESAAITDLISKVDADAFQAHFGAPLSQVDELIHAKTVTINKLMEILPGIADPTPFLYDSTMYTMAGFMGMAAIANSTIRPVNPKFFEKI